ncbi:MAG TPA: hypothetical protein VGE07_22530, partial [Herpetosiphonaceae bacterium]
MAKAKTQPHPLRGVRRAGLLGLLLLLLLAGGALGWQLWELDAGYRVGANPANPLDWYWLATAAGFIGGAVLLGGLALLGLSARAARKARRPLLALADAAGSATDQPLAIDAGGDPEV